jgi:hypothetical protein
MQHRAMFAAGLVALFSLTTPLAARAQPEHPTEQSSSVTRDRSTTIESARPSRYDFREYDRPLAADVRIFDQRFTRDVGEGCRYEARIRGPVRARRVNGVDQFLPDLSVRASVRCGLRVRAAAPPARIRRVWMSRQQLEFAIQNRARVVAPTSGVAQCSYSPEFRVSFARARIVNGRVFQACSVIRPTAIGGGPK